MDNRARIDLTLTHVDSRIDDPFVAERFADILSGAGLRDWPDANTRDNNQVARVRSLDLRDQKNERPQKDRAHYLPFLLSFRKYSAIASP